MAKKRPYFSTAKSVIDLFDKHKNWTSGQIGAELGLHPAYVRKALIRNGRKLMRSSLHSMGRAA